MLVLDGIVLLIWAIGVVITQMALENRCTSFVWGALYCLLWPAFWQGWLGFKHIRKDDH